MAGRDTVSFDQVAFTVSAARLAVTGPTPLHLTATRGGVGVELTYTFHPDDYRVDVAGRLSGVGPNGGQLLLGLGPTLANTEANLEENHRDLALVTRGGDVERTDLAKLEPAEPATLSGPFQWAALKSKYFVTGAAGLESTGGCDQRCHRGGPARSRREEADRGADPAQPAGLARGGLPLHRLRRSDGVRPAGAARDTTSTT